ncbi:N-methylhydantoinase A [Paenibacillus sophorae]|uniref:Hydantoinase/oxoprolinase family protein n=1 Tax=Paenibacillus sophorae TaxID=1333845 RepID=A0A1H8FSS2_9BACL|nr:hydantoinase/oxoprolinase family protein [Paenibacillus sophorae]QWU13965.1 hydantoinase/oxoprolinase family protein [Paenibacillus sophorae]SEN34610.1 N-methylhydantoinase A [Paenibacillus sophorae]
MGIRICTDIGGTFTDLVVVDESGSVNIFKALTTPENRVDGIINGLTIAADFYGKSLQQLMESCEYFGHGTTTSTNALIERKVAKVGLICTTGFRDVLLFREAGKENPFDWYLDYPEPYIPRYLTLPVTERINAEGGIDIPLNEDEVREVIRKFKQYDVEVVAVSLMWSFVNPAHELRIGEIIEEEWPGKTYALSHVVNPRIREYRRTVSTVIDASLKPLITHYVSTFEDRLREIGYRNELSLLTCSGGVTSPQEMIASPIYSLDSGPALAPVSGRFYAKKELSKDHVITCDMGGTSFDVSRVTDGIITISNDNVIQNERLSIPKVDVKTIGAGGGSIAWVDDGGLIRVGPEGAGSVPGPACYMRGGERATVTDANLVLGYLDENYFLGGNMKVSKELAEKAIMKSVAEPLNLSLMDAAYTIYNTANHLMTEAVRDMTVFEGIDPKEYAVVAGGGAVGMHIIPIVSQLGCQEVIVPKTASTLSAFGGVVADVVREFNRSHLTASTGFDYEKVKSVLNKLAADARAFLDTVGVSKENQVFEFAVEARYLFQERELTVPLRSNAIQNVQDLEALIDDFHSKHEFTLGSMEKGQAVEFVVWKVIARGITPEINLQVQSLSSETPNRSSLKATRKAYFREMGGQVDVQVYDGTLLQAGNKIVGPAIIEEPTTNIVVTPGSTVTLSKYENYVIDMKEYFAPADQTASVPVTQ